MKICNRCNAHQPENFAVCSQCGTPISELESTGAPMRLYMYNNAMGKQIGSISRDAVILWSIFGSMGAMMLFIVFLAIIGITIGDTGIGRVLTAIVALLAGVIPVAIALVLAFGLGKRRRQDNVAYMHYDGVLFKLTMRMMRPQSRFGSSRNESFRLRAELMRRSSNPYAYIQFFEQYLAGLLVYDPVYGGQIFIEPLQQIRVTGSDRRYYRYTYVNPNGQVLNGQLEKAYPNIEEIFNSCR